MPTCYNSVDCCKKFEEKFERIVQQKYIKSDSTIYEKLNRFGNEKEAIKLAEKKLHEHRRNGKNKPSDMCPSTTIHLLVDEIKSKITVKD